ncbi:MAG TPA: alkaline phosphatase D family protein [Opitutaceae bacterium]|nr:alkaline phosphatase D family protein [Opitutaceae bacterium]
MKCRSLLSVFGLITAVWADPARNEAHPDHTVTRLAFGSCVMQDRPQPFWEHVNAYAPDVWLWLGDTVYADSPRPQADSEEERARIVLDRMPELYRQQRAEPGYAALRERAFIAGVWDDHDYGKNDAGADWIGREEAQQHFWDFYDEPADSVRRKLPGTFRAIRFGPPGRTVQLILLDTRFFRSPLTRMDESEDHDWLLGQPGRYEINDDTNATVLGEAQWRWLEQVLREPADLRLLVSSIQVVADDHRWEKWGVFPAERRRLFRLLRETGANGVMILSGDRHSGELSLLDPAREPHPDFTAPDYPLYDLTASALTQSRPTNFAAQQEGRWASPVSHRHEINRHRIGSVLRYNHYGTLTIDWEHAGGPRLTLELVADTGAPMLRQHVALTALRPPVRN